MILPWTLFLFQRKMREPNERSRTKWGFFQPLMVLYVLQALEHLLYSLECLCPSCVQEPQLRYSTPYAILQLPKIMKNHFSWQLLYAFVQYLVVYICCSGAHLPSICPPAPTDPYLWSLYLWSCFPAAWPLAHARVQIIPPHAQGISWNLENFCQLISPVC